MVKIIRSWCPEAPQIVKGSEVVGRRPYVQNPHTFNSYLCFDRLHIQEIVKSLSDQSYWKYSCVRWYILHLHFHQSFTIVINIKLRKLYQYH